MKITNSVALMILAMNCLLGQDTIRSSKIQELINSSGAIDQAKTMYNISMTVQKETMKEFGEEFWSIMDSTVNSEINNILLEILTPIYDKHLSDENIYDILKFYKSDSGQSLINKSREIMTEAAAEGAKWGEQVAYDSYNELMRRRELRYNTKIDDCELFKEGHFTDDLNDGSTVLISRQGSQQTEIYNDLVLIYDLEWTDDCSYTITETSESDLEIKIMHVNIFETTDTSYKYIVTSDIEDFYQEGQLIMKK